MTTNKDLIALQLADALENWPDIPVDLKASAAELRRQHDLLQKAHMLWHMRAERIKELEQALVLALGSLEKIAEDYRRVVNSEFETFSCQDPGGDSDEYKAAQTALVTAEKILEGVA